MLKKIGQPKKHPLLLKTPRSIKIPEWMWRWLDSQNKSRAVSIEEALKKQYKLKEPTKIELEQKDLFK